MIKKFLRNEQGTFAINLAIGMTALLMFAGVAIDFAALTSEKSTLQDSTDIVALAAAVSGYTEEVDLQKYAEDYISNTDMKVTKVNLALLNGSIVLELEKSKEPFIMGAFGAKAHNIKTIAEVPLTAIGGDLNIALVLDTTLSMQGARMSALKSATTELLTEIETANPAGTMVSLVPFANYVRIPVSNSAENWMDAPADETRTVNVVDSNASTNCRYETYNEQPTFVCDEYVYTQRVDNNSWEGCVGSRRDGYHEVPDFEGRRIPGFWKNGYCRESWNNELIPLTKDISSVKTAINSMFARGETYIPSGLIWGWRTLSPNAPFTEALDNPNASNVLVLMTDGDNNRHLEGETNHMDGIFHHGEDATSKAKANDLTKTLCKSIKDAGIEVFTITYEVSDASTKALFKNCASSGRHYSDVNSALELKTAFLEIGTTQGETRLVR